MAAKTQTPELSYVAYLTNGPAGALYSFTLKEGAKVTELARAIHNRWDEEEGLKGKKITLYKCGELNVWPRKGRIERVNGWIRGLSETESENAIMDTPECLKMYFSSGPAPEADGKIDVVVVVTESAAIPVVSQPLLNYYSQYGWLEQKDTRWNAFYEYWSKQSFNETFKASIIPLAFDDRGYDDPSYRLHHLDSSQDQILVLGAYRRLFSRVIAFEYIFPYRGVLVTGQPGTGKTTWLWFMLICLIMKHKIVAFYSNGTTHLLYDGRVYIAGERAELPPSFIKNQMIWCLIDSDSNLAPPPSYLVSKNGNTFPVQAAPPIDARYKIWVKEMYPATFGMPLWTEEELKQGLKLHTNYNTLDDGLQKDMESDGVANAIKKYGNAPRDVYKAIFDPVGVEEDFNWALDETSLEALVNAVKLLPFALPIWCEQSPPHELLAIDLKARDEDEDDECVNFFAQHNDDEFANFFAQHEYADFIDQQDEHADFFAQHDDFIPRFRSEHIGRMAIERFGILPYQHAPPLSRVYQMLPQCSTLAAWIFDGLVHGILCNADANFRSRIKWKLVPMVSIPTVADVDGLRFSLSPARHDREPFPLTDRKFTVVEFSGGDFYWPPDENHIQALEGCLCVPKRPHNLLFNSFFVQLKKLASSVTPIVWIFHTTVSKHHKQDWPRIDSIKSKAAERAKQIAECHDMDDVSAEKAGDRTSPAWKRKRLSVRIKVNEVQVNYVSVRPYPVQACTWTMPEGWTISAKGKVYCLFIDV